MTIIPVSPNQRERIVAWTNGIAREDTVRYSWRFDRSIDVYRLREAWISTVRAATCLRTQFDLKPSDFQLTRAHIIDTTSDAINASFVEVETLEELNALSNQPLDISQAPLARLICRSSSDDSEIILIIDHAISDGQTVRVLLRMLECVLADEPMLEVNSGHDFIRGEWEAIGDSCLRRRALEHWQKLGGSYPPLTRQEPFAGADQIDMRIAKIYIAFCQEAVDAIDGPAALLASVSRAVALESPTHCGRKSGMDVSWIGVSSRRGRPSHQKILGCLANWIGIGLRIDVSKQFASGVTQARRALVEAMRHQRIAHAEVVRSLDPSIYGERWRDGSTVPRYGIFNYRAPDPTLQILGDRGRFVQPDLKPTAHGCLRVDAIPSLEDGGIRVLLQVDQNIFGSSFVDTMLTELDRTSIFHVGGEYPGLSQ